MSKIVTGTNVIVKYDGKGVKLPQNLQNVVDKYWTELKNKGKKYFNGEVFTVIKVALNNDIFEVIVSKTNFAHYLYNRNVDNELDKYNIRTIFSTGMIITNDNRVIIGKMAKHTSRAGKLQFAGGGLEFTDLKENDIFDMKRSLKKEVKEEVGLNIDDKHRVVGVDFYGVRNGENIAVVYKVKLNENFEEFEKKYKKFISNLNDEQIEFDEIIALQKSETKIKEFVNKNRINLASYMEDILLSLME